MSKPSAPKPPDYVGAANATSQGDVQTAIANSLLNRADQYNPYGSLTWEQIGEDVVPGLPATGSTGTPGYWSSAGNYVPMSGGITSREGGGTTPGVPGGGSVWVPGTQGSPATKGTPDIKIPRYASKVTLNPEQQKLFDEAQARQLGLSGMADTALMHSKDALKDPFTLDGTMADFNQEIADALYNRSARYLDPQWEKAEESERQRLANSGFSQQDEGFGDAYGTFADAKDRAYASARDTAVATGGDVGLRQRQQDISERLLARSQPLQELAALTGGSAPSIPNFPSTNVGANAQGPNLLGATMAQGQGANDIYNSEVGTYNSNVGGLAGLASSGILAYLMMAGSDERIKTDLRKVGMTDEGLPIYTFRYKGLPQFHMGVMAQDVEKVHPELVMEFDGIKAVNYAGIR